MFHVFQLKITLLDVKPIVWRQICVDSEIMLENFHKIIQTSMGWTNSHLHQFCFKDKFYCLPHEDDIPNENQIDYTNIKLNDLITKVNQTIIYEYDFGDGWQHEIKLEKLLDTAVRLKFPKCIGGERNCPPEDCGGPVGFEELLDAYKKPKSKAYKSMIEWLGEGYDPSLFEIDDVNELLKNDDFGCLSIID